MTEGLPALACASTRLPHRRSDGGHVQCRHSFGMPVRQRQAGVDQGGRVRKVLIVALARKLLIAFWKYVTAGVVLEGAETAAA
jgi:hypothetical protein